MRPEVVLTHEFVEFVPEDLREGTLYVCIPFATVVHRCCCGCGREVVTPLAPTDWTLIFDGVSVSLHPSVGNWSFPCQSHYWIQHNRAHWAGRWTHDEIRAGRAADALAKARYFGGDAPKPEPPGPALEVVAEPGAAAHVGRPGGTTQKERGWRKLFRWLFGG
jgi:hypothetical protein